jgi:hypothetical protein
MLLNSHVNDLMCVDLGNVISSVIYGGGLLDARFFAADTLLLSGSMWHLQCMLNICFECGVEFDLKFINPLKSFSIQIGLTSHLGLT